LTDAFLNRAKKSDLEEFKRTGADNILDKLVKAQEELKKSKDSLAKLEVNCHLYTVKARCFAH
jgi:hypothetical protein